MVVVDGLALCGYRDGPASLGANYRGCPITGEGP